MIPFEIEYIRPASSEDAAALYKEVSDAGRTARYLSGGPELVTMARDGKLKYDVLIDLKRIPETTILDESTLTYGACVRLSQLRDRITDRGATDLVGQAAGGVADRTTRNSITLGGNICGMLPYREALLPFLILDGEATLQSPDGRRQAPLAQIFNKRLKLEPGEFLVSLQLDEAVRKMDGFYRRRTRDPQVDYPLVTLCMALGENGYRVAVGGAFGPPVRSLAVEQALNEATAGASSARAGAATAAEKAVASFDEAFRTDMRGSAEYRKALLQQSIRLGLETLGGRK